MNNFNKQNRKNIKLFKNYEIDSGISPSWAEPVLNKLDRLNKRIAKISPRVSKTKSNDPY